MHRLSLVVTNWGYSLLVVHGLFITWLLLLQSTGSMVVVHRLSCSAACGIFLDQGSNPCLLYWQEDALPLKLSIIEKTLNSGFDRQELGVHLGP